MLFRVSAIVAAIALSGCGGANCFPDDDGDSFGDPLEGFRTADCAGEGGTERGTDCDDRDATVFPGAPELCDGQVNACGDALPADEIDGDGDDRVECTIDAEGWDGASAVVGGGDCAPADASTHPGATEAWDGEDADCDGMDLARFESRTPGDPILHPPDATLYGPPRVARVPDDLDQTIMVWPILRLDLIDPATVVLVEGLYPETGEVSQDHTEGFSTLYTGTEGASDLRIVTAGADFGVPIDRAGMAAVIQCRAFQGQHQCGETLGGALSEEDDVIVGVDGISLGPLEWGLLAIGPVESRFTATGGIIPAIAGPPATSGFLLPDAAGHRCVLCDAGTCQTYEWFPPYDGQMALAAVQDWADEYFVAVQTDGVVLAGMHEDLGMTLHDFDADESFVLFAESKVLAAAARRYDGAYYAFALLEDPDDGARSLVAGRGDPDADWDLTPILFHDAPIDEVAYVDLLVDEYGAFLLLGSRGAPANPDLVAWSRTPTL